MLDCPTGRSDYVVLGWDDAALENLPQRISEIAPQAFLVDIYAGDRIVHHVSRRGWERNSAAVRASHSSITTNESTIMVLRWVFGIDK